MEHSESEPMLVYGESKLVRNEKALKLDISMSRSGWVHTRIEVIYKKQQG